VTKQTLYKKAWTLSGIVAFVLLWQVVTWIIRSELIMPSPLEVGRKFLVLLFTTGFWQGLVASTARAFIAFLFCVILAIPLGYAMARHVAVAGFFSSWMVVLRATPVIAVILLGLLWFSPDVSPAWVGVLMILPVMVQAVVEGTKKLDPQLDEMARCASWPRRERWLLLIIPGLVPYFRAGGRSALGLCWKVVAATEVLSQPSWGLGKLLQDARSNLETGTVFAVTASIILVAALGDIVIDRCLRLSGGSENLEHRPADPGRLDG